MIQYFYGPDTYGAREEIGKLSRKQGSEIQFLDEENFKERSLADWIGQSQGLFGKRLFVVRDPGSMSKAIQEEIARLYSDHGSLTTNHLLLWERGEVDKRSKVWKAVRHEAREFPLPNVAVLETEVVAQASAGGLTLQAGAARALIDRVGPDRLRLRQEIEKLSLGHESVGVAEVEAEVIAREETGDMFAMLDALTAGHIQPALRSMQRQLAAGEGELRIMAMLAHQFRSLYLIAVGATRNLHPYVVQKNMRVAKSKPAGAWLAALTKIMATEFGIKRGKVEARTGLMMLILSLARLNPKH